MLIARDGGCTKPCCTVGAYGCQAHHADQDWANGGNTNVDDMTLACGTDNRAVDDDGWQTRINGRGECEWTPPPDLDHGQSRINYYHRPEALLRPPEDEAPPEHEITENPKQHNDADFNPSDLDTDRNTRRTRTTQRPSSMNSRSRWPTQRKSLRRRPGGHHHQLVRANYSPVRTVGGDR